MLIEACENKLKEIFKSITLHNTDKHSLLSGECGVVLFLKCYGIHFNLDLSEEIAKRIENISSKFIIDITFCDGAAGTNWLYHHLYIDDLLESKDYQYLIVDRNALKNHAIAELKKGNYDFLYGSLGIAFSLIYKTDYDHEFLKLFWIELECLFDNDMGLPQSYDLNNSIVKAGEVNLGLSHGLPSILKFCICCYKKNIQVEKAKKSAYKIIDFLVCVKSRSPGETFPNAISKRNQSPNSGSRLSWCYGDLSIGFILYQSGVAFNDSTITEFALDVMLNTIPRKSIGETNVRDAGFCHGSAGIAHIYNKMWHYTNNVLFKDACSFWIKETLDFSVNQDSPAGYKVYLKDEYPQLDSYGLLTGISGIGLALLSFINKEYDWDYCLMLNDE